MHNISKTLTNINVNFNITQINTMLTLVPELTINICITNINKDY